MRHRGRRGTPPEGVMVPMRLGYSLTGWVALGLGRADSASLHSLTHQAGVSAQPGRDRLRLPVRRVRGTLAAAGNEGAARPTPLGRAAAKWRRTRRVATASRIRRLPVAADRSGHCDAPCRDPCRQCVGPASHPPASCNGYTREPPNVHSWCTVSPRHHRSGSAGRRRQSRRRRSCRRWRAVARRSPRPPRTCRRPPSPRCGRSG